MALNAGPPPANSILDSLYRQLKEIDEMDMLLSREKMMTSFYRPSHPDSESCPFEAIPSQKYFNERLGALNIMQRKLKTIQSGIRESINTLSRPFLRPLSILDMPDEILRIIFEHVRDFQPPKDHFMDYNGRVREIQNVRLTCQRFCSTSSHLLLHYVRVELNPSSLARLEEISRHPIISKSVMTVQVILAYHDSVMARDLSLFARYHVDRLHDRITELEFDDASEASIYYEVPEKKVLETVTRLRMILEAWEDLLEGIPSDLTEEEYSRSPRKLLRKAHEEYQFLVTIQEDMVGDDFFVCAVAAAMARMPVAERLDIRDDCFRTKKRRRTLFDQADDDKVLIDQMMFPIRWEDAREHDLGPPPAEIALKLPSAVHKAGGALTYLEIQLSPPDDLSVFETSEEDRHALRAAVQKLKTLTFELRSGTTASDWRQYNQDEVKILSEFVGAILGTDSIEHISLDLSFLWDQEMPPLHSLGSIFTGRRWSKLNFICWDAMCLHQSELEQFIDGLEKPFWYSIIRRLYLMSGSWADCLDILRRKAGNSISFEDPSGAECEELNEQEIKSIFGKSYEYYGRKSLAEKFLTNWPGVGNPFREDSGNTNAVDETDAPDASDTMDTME
ncbi:hypothetical protein G7Y89_g13064 [Cudoniella acicularis]|uniref:F-box domain-containing protein n=1 Tax=Cudoniella acicularis TaxID=354080 RepID=A0A8H4RA88_9HELO|nr:hypothetical protein G7Y89_g13064 [Cudoniella acicularis]